jgi:hypothetical protein
LLPVFVLYFALKDTSLLYARVTGARPRGSIRRYKEALSCYIAVLCKSPLSRRSRTRRDRFLMRPCIPIPPLASKGLVGTSCMINESWIGDPAMITRNRPETLNLLQDPGRVWARMKSLDSTSPAFLGFTEDREIGLWSYQRIVSRRAYDRLHPAEPKDLPLTEVRSCQESSRSSQSLDSSSQYATARDRAPSKVTRSTFLQSSISPYPLVNPFSHLQRFVFGL